MALFPMAFILANYIGLSLLKNNDTTRKMYWKSFFISTIIIAIAIYIIMVSFDIDYNHNNIYDYNYPYEGTPRIFPQFFLATIYSIGFLIGGFFDASRKSIIIVGINILMLILSIFPFALVIACMFGMCI